MDLSKKIFKVNYKGTIKKIFVYTQSNIFDIIKTKFVELNDKKFNIIHLPKLKKIENNHIFKDQQNYFNIINIHNLDLDLTVLKNDNNIINTINSNFVENNDYFIIDLNSIEVKITIIDEINRNILEIKGMDRLNYKIYYKINYEFCIKQDTAPRFFKIYKFLESGVKEMLYDEIIDYNINQDLILEKDEYYIEYYDLDDEEYLLKINNFIFEKFNSINRNNRNNRLIELYKIGKISMIYLKQAEVFQSTLLFLDHEGGFDHEKSKILLLKILRANLWIEFYYFLNIYIDKPPDTFDYDHLNYRNIFNEKKELDIDTTNLYSYPWKDLGPTQYFIYKRNIILQDDNQYLWYKNPNDDFVNFDYIITEIYEGIKDDLILDLSKNSSYLTYYSQILNKNYYANSHGIFSFLYLLGINNEGGKLFAKSYCMNCMVVSIVSSYFLIISGVSLKNISITYQTQEDDLKFRREWEIQGNIDSHYGIEVNDDEKARITGANDVPDGSYLLTGKLRFSSLDRSVDSFVKFFFERLTSKYFNCLKKIKNYDSIIENISRHKDMFFDAISAISLIYYCKNYNKIFESEIIDEINQYQIGGKKYKEKYNFIKNIKNF